MILNNLRDFLEMLRREKQLVEVSAPVDPYLEIAEIHRRVIEEQGPALLFTSVKGSTFPVVTNLFGSPRRVDLAFGPRPEQLMRNIIEAKDRLMPPSLKSLWREKTLLLDLARIGTRQVSAGKAPLLERCETRQPLAKLPALTSWQKDGGPFITYPLVYTEHPAENDHNLGMYRIQLFDGQTTGMHWQIHKGGGFHYHEAEKLEKSLPVTVFLGGPPALIASAIAPVPEHLPELLLASLIMGQKLPLIEDPNGGHRLLAEAEFAICGQVPPRERRPEGPFGDHYGYYSWTHDFPVFRVSRMWHRKDAIYPATVVGKPRQEDYYLGEFLQRLLSPAFPLAMPGVKELWTYAETGFHPLAAAIVRESYAREALAAAFRILGEGQLTLTKCLLITDQVVDLSDFRRLFETILERFDPKQDLYIFDDTSHDTLDYTGGRLNHGSKAVILGVGEPIRQLPKVYDRGGLPWISEAFVYCAGCLVVSGAAYEKDPQLPQRLLEHAKETLAEWPVVVITDNAEASVHDQTAFLWTVFTRFNPATDIFAVNRVGRHRLQYELPIVIDARMKPGYPDELNPREDIVKLVSSRWNEYFP